MFAIAEDGSTYWWAILGLLSIPALIALNGLFTAAEYALVAVRKTRVEELVARGVKGAKAVDSAVRNLSRSIAATQLGITLASIGLGFVGEPALAAASIRRSACCSAPGTAPPRTPSPPCWPSCSSPSCTSSSAN